MIGWTSFWPKALCSAVRVLTLPTGIAARVFSVLLGDVRAIWRETFGEEMPTDVAEGPWIDMDAIHDKAMREEFVSFIPRKTLVLCVIDL